MMRCPACGNALKETAAGPVSADVCEGGCGGIWFDQLELRKLDEPHESAGESLLAAPRSPDVRVDRTQRRKCPKCDDMTMMRHFFSVKREVEVDECPACGGFWLDCGELADIRTQFETQEQREQAARAYFDDVFRDELAPMRAESKARAEKARRISNIFRFICPSYYIPGKQDWAAF